MIKLMKELKKPKVLITLMIIMIYILSKVERREGFRKRDAKGGFRCMIGPNREIQCNTFEEGGVNEKNFTCDEDRYCKIEGGGSFILPKIKGAKLEDVADKIMNGLGYGGKMEVNHKPPPSFKSKDNSNNVDVKDNSFSFKNPNKYQKNWSK